MQSIGTRQDLEMVRAPIPVLVAPTKENSLAWRIHIQHIFVVIQFPASGLHNVTLTPLNTETHN